MITGIVMGMGMGIPELNSFASTCLAPSLEELELAISYNRPRISPAPSDTTSVLYRS